jgi:methionine-rich copper-binding protein CopC
LPAEVLPMTLLTRVVGAMAALAMLAGLPAHAHTRLLESTPADGSALQVAPRQLQLVYSEAAHLTALTIQATGEATPRKLGPLPQQAAAKFTIDLPPLATGSYQLKWRALSDDHHVASGSISFVVRVR